MQGEGGQNKLFIPPPNILEGNRVVFETLVKKKDPPSLKNFMERGGIKKKLFIPLKYS